MKPITEDLLPKERKKYRIPDSIPEGNMLAPTRKARAKRAPKSEARKAPRKFKSRPGVDVDAMDWMLQDPVVPPKMRVSRKKKGVVGDGVTALDPTEGHAGCIPDLNEVPAVEDPVVDSANVSKKRAPRKKKLPVDSEGFT